MIDFIEDLSSRIEKPHQVVTRLSRPLADLVNIMSKFENPPWHDRAFWKMVAWSRKEMEMPSPSAKEEDLLAERELHVEHQQRHTRQAWHDWSQALLDQSIATHK